MPAQANASLIPEELQPAFEDPANEVGRASPACRAEAGLRARAGRCALQLRASWLLCRPQRPDCPTAAAPAPADHAAPADRLRRGLGRPRAFHCADAGRRQCVVGGAGPGGEGAPCGRRRPCCLPLPLPSPLLGQALSQPAPAPDSPHLILLRNCLQARWTLKWCMPRWGTLASPAPTSPTCLRRSGPPTATPSALPTTPSTRPPCRCVGKGAATVGVAAEPGPEHRSWASQGWHALSGHSHCVPTGPRLTPPLPRPPAEHRDRCGWRWARRTA